MLFTSSEKNIENSEIFKSFCEKKFSFSEMFFTFLEKYLSFLEIIFTFSEKGRNMKRNNEYFFLNKEKNTT